MKMSDDQFVNEAAENGNDDVNNFNNEEMPEDNNNDGFNNNNNNNDASESNGNYTNGNENPPATENSDEAKKVNGKDKKNLQPECFRKVFVGSLNYTTTEETMREHFGKFGDIVDCVIMKESKSGKSRGFGFVTYQDQSMVDEMMKSRPHKLDGRELETKRATPREEAGKPGAEMSTKKLFVGAIKEGMTEEHLKEYFGKYGKIEDCIVMKDKESGKPRGFGFVSFDDYDPIDKIVLEKNHTINGQAVAVKKALPKDQTLSGRNQNNNNNYNGNFNNNNNRGNNNRNNNHNGRNNNFRNNNNNGRFNNGHNNHHFNNDDFNNNNFNDNGGFNNFSNGNGNGNGNFNGNAPNGNGNGNGNGMPGFNFALIAQKMLQAANMNGGPNGNQNGNNFNNNNGNNFQGNGQFNGGHMNGQFNGNKRGGGPIRAGGNRGGRNGPYQNKKN